MANQILIKRGNEAQRAGLGAISDGEPIWVSDNTELYVGDGSTTGGVKVGPFTLSELGFTGDTDANNYNFNLDSDDASPSAIADNTTLTINGGTNCTTTHTGNTLTINVSGAGTMSSFTAAADSGTPEDISDGETLTISGDAGAITTSNTTNTVDIAHSTATGYKHIPSGGATTNVLTWSSDGTAAWGAAPSTLPVVDTTAIVKGSADDTKLVAIEADTNVPTGTTRTITMASTNIDLTPDTGTFASTGHTHDNFDRASSVESGATVFSNIVVTDGITTNIATRELSAGDIGAEVADAAIVKSDEAETITAGWTFGTTLTTFTANAKFNDNVVINLGTGNDVKHFFNATQYITELEDVDWIIRDSADSPIITITESTKAVQFGGAIVVDGDLTVSGTTTTVNTETINLADNIITLNSNYTGSSPTEHGGIEVERGTLTNATMRWNETSDHWEVDKADGTFYEISTSNSLGSYLLIADIDDSPVNGENAAPISSNWAFDHEADADPHTVYPLLASAETITGNWDFTGTNTFTNATFDGGTF